MPIISADREGLARAARRLRAGGLVAFPTETVYGLGGDARSDTAVAAIFAAKARPTFNPLITHLPTADSARRLGRFNAAALALARHFWPGALTLVLPRAAACPIAPLASAGGETIALRVPTHPIAQQLLRLADLPIAAPSANPSGRLSPTSAEHVEGLLGDRVDLILDGGACALGLESTIIACFDGGNFLLREGAVAQEAIAEILGAPLLSWRESGDEERSPQISPGRLRAHYAPRAALRLNATDIRAGEELLAFGATDLAHQLNLSPSGDLTEAASNLFAMLHALDSRSDHIAVMPIPERGLGRAINDRLRRASSSCG